MITPSWVIGPGARLCRLRSVEDEVNWEKDVAGQFRRERAVGVD